MKKLLAIILSALVITSLAACSGGSSGSTEASKAKSAATSAGKSGTPDSGTVSADGKTLIVYFSPSNSDTADAVTAATPRAGDVSSVEYVAQLISSRVDADVAKIISKEAYPEDYNETADKAKDERDNDERPEFTLDVNPEDYDTVFIGYPIWWYELPMIMRTFFDTYDFSGKTIIPFNTHAGSQDGGTYDQIEELEPDATVEDGLAVSGDQANDADDKVSEWLGGLGY